MKRILIILITIPLIFGSCKKEDPCDCDYVINIKNYNTNWEWIEHERYSINQDSICWDEIIVPEHSDTINGSYSYVIEEIDCPIYYN